MYTNNQSHCFEVTTDDDSRKYSSNGSESSVSAGMTKKNRNTLQLHVAVDEKSSKATRMQMEKEWQDSSLCINDLGVVMYMEETGIYKNVYDQYNWYLDQVFKKHSDQFRTYMERINQRKPEKYGECITLQDVVYFQEQCHHKIIDGAYMGFSEHEVKEQFGLPLESLLIFMHGSECYNQHRITYTASSSKCLIAQLKTRMLSNHNVQYLTLVNFQLPSVLCEAVDVISTLTTTSDTLKGYTSNTAEWEKSDEYRLHTEMVEKCKDISLLKCIDAYFQWYMGLVSEKHADKFTQRITEINKESSKVSDGYSISVVENNVALGLLGFQVHYKDALENGEVCMGFAKHEVDSQYGITVESLYTFNEYARKYSESGIRAYEPGSKCIVSELITRMKSVEYRTYQCDFNQNMVQILCKTLEIVSEFTTLPSKFDVKLHLQMLREVEEDKHKTDQQEEKNTNHTFSNIIAIQERISKSEEEWQNSEECRLHTKMVEKTKDISLLKCIDAYFQWYMTLISEKRKAKFTQSIAEINKESSKVPDGYTITVVENNVALGLLGFQVHYKDALENGEVCMGFAKHEVDSQYGITVESLYTFNEYARKYGESGITVHEHESDCIVSELITRMKSAEYRTYQCDFNQNMVQILCKTLEMVSNFTAPNSKLYVKLQEALQIFGEKASKATCTQMEKEWQDSSLCINDLGVVMYMEETGIYRNVYEQYNWYLDQVFKKHSNQFRTYMKRINEEGEKGTIFDECITLQDVVYFQDEYQHKIIGGVYMGFSEDNVKEQFGLPLESLLIFLEGSECYNQPMITYTASSSKCLIAQLKTRMLSNDNVEHLTLVDCQLPSVLCEAVDVISKLTTTTSDVNLPSVLPEDVDDVEVISKQSTTTSDTPKAFTSNTTKWEQSEEYRLDSEVIERSELLGLLECIDVYFQWYMKLVSEKHKAKFTQRIAEINKESSKVPDSYTITVVDNRLALALLDFQLHFEDALRNGEVCMGFAKHEVDSQYGITLESLFTFNECAEQHLKSGIKIYGDIHCCNACNLITRLKSTEYRAYQGKFNCNAVQILYQTLEAVSELSTPDSKCYVKLQEALQIASGEISPKTQIQMEKEWRASALCFGDSFVVDSMRRSIMYKNVYELYNWYLDQVFKKHSEYFSERMAEINESKRKRGMKRKCETLQEVVYFQDEYQHELTGRRDGVYMGFSEDNVKEQFGLSLKKLFIFMLGAEGYRNGIKYTTVSPKCLITQLKTPKCIIEQLKTRMLSDYNVEYLKYIDLDLPSVLSKAVDVISKLTTTTSDTL